MKRLIWLIKHQKEIQELLESKKTSSKEVQYSLAGVPEFQKKYINDILKEDK